MTIILSKLEADPENKLKSLAQLPFQLNSFFIYSVRNIPK